MRSFFEHVPERFHDELRQAIEAVTETKMLLDQVKARFGTNDPRALRALEGREFEAVPVTPAAVAELEALIAEHEARRVACQAMMDRAARGIAPDDAPATDGASEDA